MANLPLCDDSCGHTGLEHEAFDLGVAAGMNDDEECPYEEGELMDAWLAGHSVGMLNAEVAA